MLSNNEVGYCENIKHYNNNKQTLMPVDDICCLMISPVCVFIKSFVCDKKKKIKNLVFQCDWEYAFGLQLTPVTWCAQLCHHASMGANHVFYLSLNDSMRLIRRFICIFLISGGPTGLACICMGKTARPKGNPYKLQALKSKDGQLERMTYQGQIIKVFRLKYNFHMICLDLQGEYSNVSVPLYVRTWADKLLCVLSTRSKEENDTMDLS